MTRRDLLGALSIGFSSQAMAPPRLSVGQPRSACCCVLLMAIPMLGAFEGVHPVLRVFTALPIGEGLERANQVLLLLARRFLCKKGCATIMPKPPARNETVAGSGITAPGENAVRTRT